MKKLLMALFLTLGMFQTAYGLTIEIAPLKLKASVEAFGIHLGVDGRKAIVFAGDMAEDLAHIAGIGFKKSSQVLIVSGKGISKLLKTVSQGAYTGVKYTGKGAFNGVKFAGKKAYKGTKFIGKNAYKCTKFVGKSAYKGTKFVGKNGVKLVKNTIYMSGDIIDAAFDMTKDALRLGKNVIVTTYKKGKSFGSFIVKSVYKIGKAPVILISNSGEEVVKVAGYVLSLPLKIVCSVFKLTRLPVACTAL